MGPSGRIYIYLVTSPSKMLATATTIGMVAFHAPVSVCAPGAAVCTARMPKCAMMHKISRREQLFAVATTAATTWLGQPSPATAKDFGPDANPDISVLAKRAKALMVTAQVQAKTGVPMEARVGRIERKKKSVLTPLL